MTMWRRLKILLFGYCSVYDHKWQMQHDGWQSRREAFYHPDGSERKEVQYPVTKKWIYYRCKRCPATAE